MEKSKKTKALSILLSLLLVFSAVTGIPVNASAEGTSSFTVTVGDGSAIAGGIVEVPVTLSNVDGGYTALGFAIDYDPDVLTLAEKVAVDSTYEAKLEAGDIADAVIFEQSQNLTDDPYNLIWAFADGEAVTTDGVVATLKFTVNANATAGTTTEVAIAAAAKSGSMNGNEDVDVKYVNGTVTVASAECAHEWGAWNITQPTKTETGLKTRTCTLCGEVEEVVIEAAKLDETLIFNNTVLNISSTFNLSFRIKRSLIEGYATTKVIATPQKYYDDTLMEYTADPLTLDLVYKTKNNDGADLNNIGMYELGLNVDAYMACYDADGVFVAYSETITANPATILKGMIQADSTDSQVMKRNALIVDVLNLGTEAQSYFPGLIGSTTCDLYLAEKLNSGVDTTLGSGELNIEDLTVGTDPVWNPESTVVTSAKNALRLSVNIKGSPVVAYRISQASSTGSAPIDTSKLTLNVSYTTLNGGEAVVSDEVTGNEWAAYVNGKHLYYTFTKLAMYDGNKLITATLTYDGTEVWTSQYTLEQFVAANTATPIVVALGKFSLSSRAYFATLGAV